MMRRFSRTAALILPGAALVLLPKCPLCLAAWLTAVTGIGFSASGAAWARVAFVVFSIISVALAAASAKKTAARQPSLQTNRSFHERPLWSKLPTCHVGCLADVAPPET
jgi:hypothetical protein